MALLMGGRGVGRAFTSSISRISFWRKGTEFHFNDNQVPLLNNLRIIQILQLFPFRKQNLRLTNAIQTIDPTIDRSVNKHRIKSFKLFSFVFEGYFLTCALHSKAADIRSRSYSNTTVAMERRGMNISHLRNTHIKLFRVSMLHFNFRS
jgi:hypothetical protein